MANLAPKATLELVEADAETVESLRQKLLDPNTSLPEKYRVMFSLRNVAGHAAHEALLTGAPCMPCMVCLSMQSMVPRHDSPQRRLGVARVRSFEGQLRPFPA